MARPLLAGRRFWPMTSQVGLLNRNSVALASDSATAWGVDHFAPVYNTSEKIYQLAGRQPVGYMNYNQGLFMGHSWDRIFGMYREHMFTPPKGNKRHEHKELDHIFGGEVLEHEEEYREYKEDSKNPGYVEHFLKFLEEEDKLDDDGIELQSMIQEIKALIIDHMPSLGRLMENLGAPKDLRVVNEPDELFSLRDEQFELTAETLSGITEMAQHLIGERLELLEEEKRDSFEPLEKSEEVLLDELVNVFTELGLPPTPELREALSNIGGFHLASGRFSWPGMMDFSGITIAGFGKNEESPTLVEIRIRTKWKKKLRYEIHSVREAPNIAPLAQTQNIDPLLQSMEAIHIIRLSPRDLANFAEKLVEMEATVQYVTQASRATVGGPIDVVSITKEDGLVWIKRKDVIDERLNPRIYKTPRPAGRHI